MRKNFCQIVYDGLNIGGAFILCEKVYQENGLMQEILSFSHYDYKSQHFTEQEIINKERDLRYIMKPNTINQNIDLLNQVGFRNISTFWQSYNFVGIIALFLVSDFKMLVRKLIISFNALEYFEEFLIS